MEAAMSQQQLARDPDSVRAAVTERYAAAARHVTGARSEAAACCGGDPATSCCRTAGEAFGNRLYGARERDALPDTALLASLGCGNPIAVAELEEGETVLDLGSGGGIDVLLSAGRVGATGEAYGLDMTDEMLDLARANQAKAGARNVEWLKGHIEE